MLKFNLPVVPALQPLIKALTERQVDIYLYGELPDSHMLFVDVDWGTAEKLNRADLARDWTLIYAFFLSSDALARNQPDPLMANVPVTEILKAYRPKGFTQDTVKDNIQVLIEQAEYLLNFPPSRLVWLAHDAPSEFHIAGLMRLLR